MAIQQSSKSDRPGGSQAASKDKARPKQQAQQPQQPQATAQATSPEPQADAGESRRQRIERQAYERFQARGGEHGHAERDWLDSEAAIDAEIDGQPARPGDGAG